MEYVLDTVTGSSGFSDGELTSNKADTANFGSGTLTVREGHVTTTGIFSVGDGILRNNVDGEFMIDAENVQLTAEGGLTVGSITTSLLGTVSIDAGSVSTETLSVRSLNTRDLEATSAHVTGALSVGADVAIGGNIRQLGNMTDTATAGTTTIDPTTYGNHINLFTTSAGSTIYISDGAQGTVSLVTMMNSGVNAVDIRATGISRTLSPTQVLVALWVRTKYLVLTLG